MDQEMTVTCGGADVAGVRLVSATRDGQEFAERVRLEKAFERVRFAARALRHFRVELTPERLAELDLQLVRAPREAEERPAYSDEPQIVRFSDIKAEGVKWLWPGRIARGAITLVAGDPGLGKSLVALDIAARVSRGMDWPDGAVGLGQPASVVLLNGEDDLQTTVRARLEAMGADCDRIVTVEPQRDGWYAEEPPPFELDQDIDELRRTVARLRDCALVVFDPISAFLGRTGECSNAVVRRLLAPLSQLARRKQLAVLMVAHLRKEAGVAVRRAMGSMAFVAVSRAAWLVSRDAERPGRRLMLSVKNNLAVEADGLAFEVVEAALETLGGQPVNGENANDLRKRGGAASGRVVVKWSPERICVRSDGAFWERGGPACRPDTERRDAVEWLRNCLSSGPRGAAEVRELAEGHGYAFTTLRRAFRELGGVAVKGREERHGGWLWKLPGEGNVEERSGGAGEESVPRVAGVGEMGDGSGDEGVGEAAGVADGEVRTDSDSEVRYVSEEARLRAAFKASEESAAAIKAKLAAYAAEEIMLPRFNERPETAALGREGR